MCVYKLRLTVVSYVPKKSRTHDNDHELFTQITNSNRTLM